MKKRFTLLFSLICIVGYAQISNTYAVTDTTVVARLDRYQNHDTAHEKIFKTKSPDGRSTLYFNAIPNRYMISLCDYDGPDERAYVRKDEIILVRDAKTWKGSTDRDRNWFDATIQEFLRRMDQMVHE